MITEGMVAKMDDANIIALYFQRSETALGETEKKYGLYCHKIADNILNSREDSEECLNDTWLKAWKSIPPSRPLNLKTFLGAITRNIALSIWRRRNSEKRTPDRLRVCLDELTECLPSAQESICDDFAVKDAIERFLRELSLESREMFIKRYWYGMSVEEIARELSKSKGSVKMSLMRTREKLRLFLEKEGIAI